MMHSLPEVPEQYDDEPEAEEDADGDSGSTSGPKRCRRRSIVENYHRRRTVQARRALVEWDVDTVDKRNGIGSEDGPGNEAQENGGRPSSDFPQGPAAAQEQSSRAPKNDKEGILAELATLIHEARESETRSLDVRVSKLERRQKGRKVKNALANAER